MFTYTSHTHCTCTHTCMDAHTHTRAHTHTHTNAICLLHTARAFSSYKHHDELDYLFSSLIFGRVSVSTQFSSDLILSPALAPTSQLQVSLYAQDLCECVCLYCIRFFTSKHFKPKVTLVKYIACSTSPETIVSLLFLISESSLEVYQVRIL